MLAQHRAVVAGAGIAVLPAFIADNDSALRPVLAGQANFTRTFWMSMPAETKHLVRMQTVWDFLRQTALAHQALLLLPQNSEKPEEKDNAAPRPPRPRKQAL